MTSKMPLRSWWGLIAGFVILTGCTSTGDTSGPTSSDAASTELATPTGTTVSSVTRPSASATSAPPQTSAPPAKTSTSATAEPTVISQGLQSPWSIAFYQATPLVSERDSARILELAADGSAREIAVISGVAPTGEGGLLGIAVRDDTLYAYFTTASGNQIARFPIEGRPGSLTLGRADVLVDSIPAAAVHNGGRLAFGPDGMLYATTGDAGDRGNAQDRDSLAGKILRMTPDGGVPADNPFPDSLVYSYGHRNAQGIAWADDGTMYASEFGQNTWDELNVIEPGGNYGWPVVEGIAGREGYVDPVQQWAPAGASPSGLAIADGRAYMANLRGQRIRVVPLSDPGTSTERFASEFGRLRDVVVTPDGVLWLLTNNTDGRGQPSADDDRIIAFSG